MRYHAYALLPLAFGLTVAELGGGCGGVAVGLGAALLVGLPALCVWPRLAESLVGGHPWLPLSTVEVGSIGCSAVALVAALRPAAATARWVTGATFARLVDPVRSVKGAAMLGGAAVVLGSSVIHPAVSALVGTAALGAAVAGLPARTAPWAAEWLQMHFLGSAIPAAVWALGWAMAGSSCRYPALGLERVATAAAGVHAWSVAVRVVADEHQSGPWKGRQVVCASLAVWTAAAGLWGRLHFVLLAAAALSAWDLLWWIMRRQKWEIE